MTENFGAKALHKHQKYTLSNHNHQTDELALLSQDSPQATVS